MNERIKGLINAPFTPFHKNGEVNTAPIERYAEMLKNNGIKGVFVNGSSGEGYLLTDEERMRIAEKWMQHTSPDFKIIIHVGSTSIKSGMQLAKHAQEIGAWGTGAMASPFPKVTRVETLVEYCAQIAASAPKLPFYFYHIPGLSGVYLPMLSFLEAADGVIPNFAGIKYTFENQYEFNQCRLYKNGKYDMLHGQDETLLASLAMCGTEGGIGGTTNYNARELNGIISAWQQGDIDTAREKQNFSQAVINIIIKYRGNIVAGKRIMKLIGLDLGNNRLPFQNLSGDEEISLKKELENIGFFERCNKF